MSCRGSVLRNAWRTASARGVAAVGRRVERATVVEDEVDVLVGRAVTGDDLDTAVGERLELGQEVGRRLRLDEVDLLVLHRLHRRRRVADDAVDDRRHLRLRAPGVVRVDLERHLADLLVGREEVRAGAQVEARVVGQAVESNPVFQNSEIAFTRRGGPVVKSC